MFSRLRITTIIATAALTLGTLAGLSGCAGGGQYGVGDAFINDILKGDMTAAYAMLSPRLQAIEDQATFTSAEQSEMPPNDCKMTWNSLTTGPSTTSTPGTATQANGVLTCSQDAQYSQFPAYNVSVWWVKINGTNKIDDYEIQP